MGQLDSKKLVAEFFGTLILVVVAVGVATESFGFKLFGLSFSAGVVTTALAFGLVLGGARLRHRADLGVPRQPGRDARLHRHRPHEARRGRSPTSWPSCAGAIAGAYLLYAMLDHVALLLQEPDQGLGTDGYGTESHLHVSEGGAFLIEVVLTAVFVMVVLFATHKAAIQGAAGVAIGFGLVVVHLIGIPLTGTSVNPAREPRARPWSSAARRSARSGSSWSPRWSGRSWPPSSTWLIADSSKDDVSRWTPNGRRSPLRSGPWI